MQCSMNHSQLILLLIAFFVSQITSKDITFHNVVIAACDEGDVITIAEGERIKDFIPRNCSFINIDEQNMPVLFESSFGDMAAVRFLLLGNNSISEIRPGVFTGSSKLELIDLQDNNIEEIKAGVFNTLKIHTLWMSHNSISKIDSGAFDNLPSLDTINLDHNKIGAWDSNWFRNSHALIRIFLHYNEIKYLPNKGFEGMLESMEAQSNDDMRASTEHLDSIKKNVSTVSLAHNQISSIENDFLNEIFVNYFDLSNNNIECLEDLDFKVLTKHFDSISINGNPMNSECIDRLREIGDENNYKIQIVTEW